VTATAVGTRVRQIRKAAGLSQSELAERAGTSMNGIALLEQGRIRDPHLSTLEQIAQGLGVPFAELFGEDAPKAPARLPAA
jgi:transcriptional regulator with XRE-family HTH domain